MDCSRCHKPIDENDYLVCIDILPPVDTEPDDKCIEVNYHYNCFIKYMKDAIRREGFIVS